MADLQFLHVSLQPLVALGSGGLTRLQFLHLVLQGLDDGGVASLLSLVLQLLLRVFQERLVLAQLLLELLLVIQVSQFALVLQQLPLKVSPRLANCFLNSHILMQVSYNAEIFSTFERGKNC